MDKRLAAILCVVLIELFMRSIYGMVHIDAITFTLAVRVIQAVSIILICRRECGIRCSSITKELLAGILISVVFGALVMLSDLVSRIFLPGGLLGMVVSPRPSSLSFMFLVTGCIVAPFVEELFFRGLLYAWMRQRAGMIASVILSSLIFASMHGVISPVQLTGGIAFAIIYERRQNIWAAYVLHALANFGIWVLPFIHPLL